MAKIYFNNLRSILISTLRTNLPSENDREQKQINLQTYDMSLSTYGELFDIKFKFKYLRVMIMMHN